MMSSLSANRTRTEQLRVRAGVGESLRVRGGGGTASLRVGTQNKTTDLQFGATTALSHCPCWLTAPCFQGIRGQPVVITVVTAACPQWTSFSADSITPITVAKTLIIANPGCVHGLKTTVPTGNAPSDSPPF